MKKSYYIKSESDITRLNTFFNRELRNNGKNSHFNLIDEFYISGRLLFTIFEKEHRDGSESPLFGKLYNLKKPINIIPSSFEIYKSILTAENNDGWEINGNEGEPNHTTTRITKLDYLSHFYNEISEDPLQYAFKDDIFSLYEELEINMNQRLVEIKQRQQESTLLSFLPESENLFAAQKRILPYLFLDAASHEDTSTLSQLLESYSTELQTNSDFLLYTNIENFSCLSKWDKLQKLGDFRNILIWITDFNEFYANKDEIKKLRDGLEVIYGINQNIIYLFGGLMITTFFEDYLKEIVFRLNLYPSKKVLPHSEVFGRITKKIFFPYFGRVTTPEKILDAQYRHYFECTCHSCAKFIQDGRLNVVQAIEKIEKSSPSNFYHNFYSMLHKIKQNLPAEINPDLDFHSDKLFRKWEATLNE